ncbi:MAG: integrin alpha, partial [Myxococcota bacterium]
ARLFPLGDLDRDGKAEVGLYSMPHGLAILPGATLSDPDAALALPNTNGPEDLIVGMFNRTLTRVTRSGNRLAIGGLTGPTQDLGPAWGDQLHAVGDVDGDGLEDFVNYESEPETNASVFLVLGNRGPADPVVLEEMDLTNECMNPGESRFGWAVTAVGDHDGDGFSDFAVSAPGSGSGVVYMYFGHPSGEVRPAPFTLRANHSGFGLSLGAPGDMNGDGRPDLAALAVGCVDCDWVSALNPGQGPERASATWLYRVTEVLAGRGYVNRDLVGTNFGHLEVRRSCVAALSRGAGDRSDGQSASATRSAPPRSHLTPRL